jgi:acyl-coenzyme A thioesterase PaaI-like protein
VHAIALAHVAELAANAALAYSLEDDMRFIPTEINIRYLKKAHGTITAECNCSPSFGRERQEVVLTVNLSDPEGNRVAEATQKVLIGPMPAS